MDFGIGLATTLDSWQVVKRAEALGFTHAWFYDSQLLYPDVFMGMTLAARETKSIRLGTGVLVPSNRLAPVAANCLATLNKLAPGRIDFGIGTGFTARRTMGQYGVKLADMGRYVDQVMGLLRGETVACELEGKAHKVRFMHIDAGLINVADPVQLHVSAMGPQARKLTARLGGGWLNFSGDNDNAIASLSDMKLAWGNARRPRSALYSSLFALGCVLRKGERLNSKRVLAQSGPYVAAMLHSLLETVPPEHFRSFSPTLCTALEAYNKVYALYAPEDARYLSVHRGHLLFVRDDEKAFITQDLIESLTYTAKALELTDRVDELRDAGYSQFTIQLVHGHEDALEDWAEVLKPLGLKALTRSSARKRTGG